MVRRRPRPNASGDDRLIRERRLRWGLQWLLIAATTWAAAIGGTVEAKTLWLLSKGRVFGFETQSGALAEPLRVSAVAIHAPLSDSFHWFITDSAIRSLNLATGEERILSLDVVGLKQPYLALADPGRGSVWVLDHSALVEIGNDGSVKTRRAFDVPTRGPARDLNGRIWVITETTIYRLKRRVERHAHGGLRHPSRNH
jgi:hypothetical protein